MKNKNKLSKYEQIIEKFKNHKIIAYIFIIGAVLMFFNQFYPVKDLLILSYKSIKNNFFSSSFNKSDTNFKVILFNFKKYNNQQDIKFEEAISDKFQELVNIEKLHITFKVDNTDFVPITIDEAKEEGKKRNADLVIFGTLSEKPKAEFSYKWALIKDIETTFGKFSKNSSSIELNAISDIREGNLLFDLDYIFYFVSGLYGLDNSKFNEALISFNTLFKKFPEYTNQDPIINLYTGQIFHSFQKIDSAKYFYLKSLKIDSTTDGKYKLNLFNNLAVITQDNDKNYELARTYYLKGIKSNPDNFLIHYNYATFLEEVLSQYTEAKMEYLLSIKVEPTFAAAHNRLGALEHTTFINFFEAKKQYELAIQLDPNMAEAYNNLALLLKDHFQDYDGAEKNFLKAIQLVPYNPAYIYNLGKFYEEKLSNYETAKKYYEKSIQLDSNFYDGYLNLGTYYANYKKNYIEAKKNFLKALQINPSLIQAHYNIAIILNDIFYDYKEAKNYIENVLRIDPNYKNAKKYLLIIQTNLETSNYP